MNAKPFLKWAGGKTQLINDIKKVLPEEFHTQSFTYIEPFVGSGAVLFWVLNNFPNVERAIINDINGDLINTYNIIAKNPSDLIAVLQEFQTIYYTFEQDTDGRKEYYYAQRALFNSRNTTKITQAALFIFLNRTCFNGLFRVNASNVFNVPIGSYIKPMICDAENIIAVSELLQNVEILQGDYENTLEHATENTLFYFDPPYKPLSQTSSFNAYAKDVFDDAEQIRLRDFCATLDNLNHKWILSNSDVKGKDITDNFFDDIYEEFNLSIPQKGRAFRYNLLFFKEKNKRIFTSIPNAKFAA